MTALKSAKLAACALALLMLPAQAPQHRGGTQGSAPTRGSTPNAAPSRGSVAAPSRPGGVSRPAPEIFRGGPRGAMNWGDFHHDAAPNRLAPHRYSGTNLPRPNLWQGNPRRFDLRNWQGGGWRHESHGGRFGWWWVVGPDWYFFDYPVYPYPDLYTPFGAPIGWWYWCDPYQEYYPFVTYCPVPWESVMPRD